MQVILKSDIPNLGRIGELAKVRPGYARNFLIPRGMAIAANPSNVAEFEHHKKLVELHKKKVQKESEAAAQKISEMKVSIQRRVNAQGKLFGQLNPAEIAQELSKKNLKLDRRDIEIDTIRNEGTYEVKVRLPGDVYATISLEVKGLKDTKEAKTAGKKPRTPRASKKTTEEEGEETEKEVSE